MSWMVGGLAYVLVVILGSLLGIFGAAFIALPVADFLLGAGLPWWGCGLVMGAVLFLILEWWIRRRNV